MTRREKIQSPTQWRAGRIKSPMRRVGRAYGALICVGSVALVGASAGPPVLAAEATDLVGSQAPAKSVAASEAAPPPTTGQVIVFEHELTPLTTFDNPDQCNNAPALAHAIVNFTVEDILLYADDRCGVPLVTVKPGYGSHVAPGQSFSAR